MKYDDLPRNILGLAAALAGWFMMPLAVFYSPLLAFIPVILSLIGVYAGWIWTAVGAVGMSVCAFISMDAVMAGAAALGLACPVAALYLTHKNRMPFVKSVVINTGAFAALAVLALMLIKAFRGGIAEVEGAYVQKIWDAQLNLDIRKNGIWETMQGRWQLIAMFASKGYLTPQLIQELQGSPSPDVYTRCIEYIIYTLKSVVNVTVTGEVASAALAAGVIMTSGTRTICARRGEEPAAPVVPLRNWYLSSEQTLYSCGLYILSSILLAFLPDWWFSVDYAIKQCVAIIMCIQGAAAVERKLRKYDIRRGLRGPILFLLVLLLRKLVTLAGVLSALFGSHGAISTWLLKKMNESDDDDE